MDFVGGFITGILFATFALVLLAAVFATGTDDDEDDEQ